MNEFREEKKKLEEDILKLINEFEKKYNCYINEIDLIHNGGRTVSGELYESTIRAVVDFKLRD